MKLTEREQIASSKLQEIAKDIKEKLPDGMGFALLAYEFGDADGRRLMYVSNSHRADVQKAMLEFCTKLGDEEYGKEVK